MATLEQLAPYVRKYMPGIDWSALAQRGETGVYSTGYVYDYMLPAYREAYAVRQTLELQAPSTVDPAEVRKAWSTAGSAMQGVTEAAMTAASQGFALVSEANALRLGTEVYRILINGAWLTALYGAVLHTTGAIHHAGVQWAQEGVAPEEVEARITRHAVLVTTLFQGLTWLDAFGVLKPLKKKGLGLAPLIVGIIAIALVAALVVLAWFIISMKDVADKNREIAKLCQKASEKGDEKALSVCREALLDPSRNPGTWGKDLVQQIALYGGIGLFGYAVIMSMPKLISSSRAGAVT